MISIVAGAAGCSIAASSALANRHQRPIVWRGVALGAQTQIILYHEDREKAADILDKCRVEISRLENLFSLYRESSQVNQLNHNGIIKNPDFDLLDLCSKSTAISEATNGAFDITVQPLWNLFSNHFPATSGPNTDEVSKVMELVDYLNVELSAQSIRLKKKGMAVTFNGIAQGYITDKIAGLLKSNSWSDVLIDLGEVFALGSKPEKLPWQVAIADPANLSRSIKTVALRDRALATSGGYGTKFSIDGKHHHLFDPATGASATRYKSVSVVAPKAVLADGLSTAFSAMKMGEIKNVLQRYAQTSAFIIGNDDKLVIL